MLCKCGEEAWPTHLKRPWRDDLDGDPWCVCLAHPVDDCDGSPVLFSKTGEPRHASELAARDLWPARDLRIDDWVKAKHGSWVSFINKEQGDDIRYDARTSMPSELADAYGYPTYIIRWVLKDYG